METSPEIKLLSDDIWRSCKQFPTRKSTEQFSERLAGADISKFIVHNFRYHYGKALSELLLATFGFWKNLSMAEWVRIFENLRGNRAAEYQMAVAAKLLLGINPNYKSVKNLEFIHVTSIDCVAQRGKPSLFIGDMKGELKKCYEQMLDEYGISTGDLLAIHYRLNKEFLDLPKPKSPLLRIIQKFTISTH